MLPSPRCDTQSSPASVATANGCGPVTMRSRTRRNVVASNGPRRLVACLRPNGIFFPIQELWAWVQVVAQVFSMFWLGLGMRSAFLPDTATAIEIGGSWRSLETVLVLAAWAVAGAVVAPRVLRRMSRRASGATVQTAREQAAQSVR